MSLIAYDSNPPETPAHPVSNAGFWPDIDPSHFRASERVDDTITDTRARAALQTAITDINRQLSHWQDRHQEDGATSVEDIPVPSWMPDGGYQQLYLRAVYATAMATLMERYREYSATSDGDDRGKTKDTAADDYRRDARWAVAEIEDRTHTTVELI